MELTYATVAALPGSVRGAVVALRDAGADQTHLAALVAEVHRLRSQAGHLMVDRDRQVQEASRRALDCDAHGTQLQELEGQVAHFSAQAERMNRARVALLELAQGMVELGPGDPVGRSALKAAARKSLDAHTRRMNA